MSTSAHQVSAPVATGGSDEAGTPATDGAETHGTDDTGTHEAATGGTHAAAADDTTDAEAAAPTRRPLRAWLSQGSYGPTDLTRRGVLLVVVSVLAVLVPVVTLTLLDVDSHVSLKVWILAVTVIALLGALLRVVADMRPGPRSDLDRAGKAVGAVAALFTALAVIIDWSLLHL
ncbi:MULTISPECIES: hypothetical protein [unclassified Rathayibacter]|uniref:hypothetical protein n=1 Tax=unclassified Rathayibacter TaxID=2609250 RepID=UPI0010DDBF1A|nr:MULTISPECIES: hypothetical protein [unclassified Rathayibacter]TCL85849.1 hypothetical protein EDF49_101518 [Rathayibacter sp. PhB192]TCM31670.1 hypothetical protein EDF43_101518 [Rathayibacter sp. PhB179]